MRIDCRITDLDPQPPLQTFFGHVLAYATKTTSLDEAAIDRVIIASADRFGDAVNSVRAGATHTDNDNGVAGGKTIPRRSGNGVVSDLILQSFLFDSLCEVLSDPPTCNHWGIDQQQALYVICHELGHSQDYSIRADVSDIPDPRPSAFSIDNTAKYYGNILLSEYAACRNSVSQMTDMLFDHALQEADDRMVQNQQLVTSYVNNPNQFSRNAIAHVLCQGAWVVMVELAKLYGHVNGLENRLTAVCGMENALLKKTPLGDKLKVYGEAYPQWDIPSQTRELSDIWQVYSRVFGVRFFQHGGQDDFQQLT